MLLLRFGNFEFRTVRRAKELSRNSKWRKKILHGILFFNHPVIIFLMLLLRFGNFEFSFNDDVMFLTFVHVLTTL